MRKQARRFVGGCSSREWLVVLFSLLVLASAPATAQSSNDAGAASPGSVKAEATVESLFRDFMHYARIGRPETARSFAEALLKHPDLDPVKLMKIANEDPANLETLIVMIKNVNFGDSAQRVLDLIEEGERIERCNPERIRANIRLLGGDPQQEFFARKRLANSGECAIPQLVQVLLDKSRKELWHRVVSALPQIGKPAVNPLVMAIRVRDEAVRQNLIGALGEIGYPQAIPYLRQLMTRDDVSADSKQAADAAIHRIEEITGRSYPGEAYELFYYLGDAYYSGDPAYRADPRDKTAKVWYWNEAEQGLEPIVVPTKIFGEIMAMRCAEEALSLKKDLTEADALWYAADIRREARLGYNVESGNPAEEGEADPTRPPNFPRALYFTQAAGPRYDHLVLARAVADNDSAVALGAIKALRATAGAASLVGPEDYKQPLVEALHFPDMVVRMRAALALGAALPKSQFANSQWVMPVLSQALKQTGQRTLLVVDADEQNANRVAEALRADAKVLTGTSFYAALERARVEFPVLSGIFVSTAIREPGLPAALASLRSEFAYSKTPVVILADPDSRAMADELAKADADVQVVDSLADAKGLTAAFDAVRARTGQADLNADVALSIALETTQVLHDLALDGRTIFNVDEAEPALISALSSEHEKLQIAAANVLALIAEPTAQRSVAHVALSDKGTDSLRMAAFAALAESAKRNGNLLEDPQIAALVSVARDEPNLTMREAASQALGAMNLESNRSSDIIRKYYGG